VRSRLASWNLLSAWKAIVKQVSVNICIALAAGGNDRVGATLWKGNPFLGIVLASAMIFNLGLMAGFAGAAIPVAFEGVQVRPRIGPGIIVTGLTDAFGFLSFLGLATLFPPLSSLARMVRGEKGPLDNSRDWPLIKTRTPEPIRRESSGYQEAPGAYPNGYPQSRNERQEEGHSTRIICRE